MKLCSALIKVVKSRTPIFGRRLFGNAHVCYCRFHVVNYFGEIVILSPLDKSTSR